MLTQTEKENDNIETVKGLKEAIQTWLETVSMPFEGWDLPKIEEFEFESRDGFRANSWNRGGLDLFHMTDIRSLTGSGGQSGLSIEDWVNEQESEAIENAIKEGLEDGSNEFYEFVDNATSSEYDAIAYRIRVMYEGEGVLKVYAGYDKDAPYFRWKGGSEFEAKIEFKTIAGLSRKLKALTKKLEKAQ